MVQQVTPYLLYEDAESAVEFATQAFGFREMSRATGSAGGLHAELELPEGGQIFIGQPPRGYRNPVLVGARILEEPNDLPFGQRRYGCADPQGHEWYFAQPIAQ